MSTSLPSKRFVIVDTPEVENFRGTFNYTFFTPDERINEAGSLPPGSSVESINATQINPDITDTINFRRFVPRHVSFSWTPVVKMTSNVESVDVSIEENLSKVQPEDEFGGDNFATITVQDDLFDERAKFYVRRLLEDVQRRQSSSPSTSRPLDPFKAVASPLDVSKYLNENTTDEIKADFLADILANLQDKNSDYLFVNAENRQVLLDSIVETIKKVSIRGQISQTVLGDTLRGNVQSPLRFLTDDLLKLQQENEMSQRAAELQNPANLMNAAQYDFEVLDYLSVLPVDAASFRSIVQPIGYIIEKEEITNQGNIKKNSIVVENPFASFTIDKQVKYGATYRYRIRTVVYVRSKAEDLDTNEIVAIDFLLGSGWSHWERIVTEETVAPPPPVDVNAVWDFAQERLCIHWSFPVNPQRDIKYFQVFRRASINEPFELIAMYDFDDSVEKSPVSYETPDPQLIEQNVNPKSFYFDPDFTKRNKYIYAICALDAHQFSSPYSVQFEVSFDTSRNRLVKKQISPAGAPKPYPNIYLLQDTFVDTIKDEGHSKVQIVFDPEYLEVYDNDDNALHLIKTGDNTRYKLQLVNIDLQQQQTVSLKIENRRS